MVKSDSQNEAIKLKKNLQKMEALAVLNRELNLNNEKIPSMILKRPIVKIKPKKYEKK